MSIVDLKTIEEKELWQLFQTGDEAAFSLIYSRYIQVIYNYCSKFSDDETLIEDCIHNLFLDLWKNRVQLSVPTSIRYYLYASVKRRIAKEVLNKKHIRVSDDATLEAAQKEVSVSTEDLMIESQNLVEQKESLINGLSLLSKNQQQAIYLRFYEDLTFQQISVAMNMSTDNIYKLVSRGLSVLKRNMNLSYVLAPIMSTFFL